MKKIFAFLLFIQLQPAFAGGLTLDDHYERFGDTPVNLKALIGKQPVYLKFWATWCLDCRHELPSLEQTYERFHDRIAMFAVNLNINETPEQIQILKDKYHLTIPIVMDNNGSIAGNFQFHGTPFHVLIDANGTPVYTTYKDDEQLQKNLTQLAFQGRIDAPVATAAPTQTAPPKTRANKDLSLLFFTATWCDWYMKDIHPAMSDNCINATQLMNQLAKEIAPSQIQAYVTHLWTEAKDAEAFAQKFATPYPVRVDTDNQQARQWQVSDYPTLLVLKNGQELQRFTDFHQQQKIYSRIHALKADSRR